MASAVALACLAASPPAQAAPSYQALTGPQLVHLAGSLHFAPKGFTGGVLDLQKYGAKVKNCDGLPNSLLTGAWASSGNKAVVVLLNQVPSPALARHYTTNYKHVVCDSPVVRVKATGLPTGSVEFKIKDDTDDGLVAITPVGDVVLITAVESLADFHGTAQQVLRHAAGVTITAYQKAALH